MSATVEEIVGRAQRGESVALDELIGTLQPKMYGLALRMLWHPEDAKDATQEILLRIVTHLATFRGQSSFSRGLTELEQITFLPGERAEWKHRASPLRISAEIFKKA